MIFLLATLAAPAHATIVNVLTPTVGAPEPGLGGSLRAAGTVLTGNEEKRSVSGNAGVRDVVGDHELRLVGSAEWTTTFDEATAEKAFANARWIWTFADPLGSFVFVQADHNAFRSLRIRDLAGAGLTVRLWRTSVTEAHLGVSLMTEHQVLEAGVVDDGSGVHLRNSDYFTVALDLDDRVVLAATTFFQPRVDAWADWRLLHELSLTVDLLDFLDWNASFMVEHDTRPAGGVLPTDTSLSTGLVVGF